ncbi:IS66 family transposase, partial [Lactobacillus helveticus]|nr:IS66 family transposase [Lactobacillus helveticus]
MKTRIFPVETEEIAYRRRRRKAKRANVLKAFASEEIHHQLTGKDLLCPDCQQEMKEIGSCPVRQELLFIPAQIKRLDHIQHAYKCQCCSLKNTSDKIVKAPVPKAPLAHSYGSASVIAHTIYQKYELKVPAYRQKNDWQKMGLPITRRDIINWQIKSTEYYFKPLYQLLKKKLLEQKFLHAD